MIAQKIAYNVLFVGASKVISIGLALFALGYLSRYLGTEGFGQYVLALSYLGFMMATADMGLHAIATREISREGASENSIINKVFSLRLLITGIVFIGALLLIGFLPYSTEQKAAIFVISAAFLFSSSYSLLNGVFQKHIAMDRVAVAELCGKLVQVVTIVVLVKFQLPFIASVFAVLGAMITNFMLIFIFVRKYVKISLEWDVVFWKGFLRKSLPLGVSALATFLYFKVDTIILSFYQPLEHVGIYGAAYKIIETLVFFPAMVVGLVLPLLSRYIFTDEDKFRNIVEATIKFFSVILVPLVISLVFLAPLAIQVINGPDFTEAVIVLQIIAFSLVGIFFGHLFMSTAIAANMQRTLMKLLLLAAAFNIVTNIILIPIYSYIGAAITSVVTELLVMAGIVYVLRVKTSYSFALPGMLYYVVAGIVMVGIYMLSPLHTLINAGIACAVYVGIIYSTGIITREDLRSIRPSSKSV